MTKFSVGTPIPRLPCHTPSVMCLTCAACAVLSVSLCSLCAVCCWGSGEEWSSLGGSQIELVNGATT